MKLFHKKIAEIRGTNCTSTPTEVITDQMLEPRPLPLGRKDFHAWSDRIISGALLHGVSPESQKFALADSLLHLGPTESHKPDAHFIHLLRKFAVNQVAHEMRAELKETHTKNVEAAKADPTIKVVQTPTVDPK